MHERGIALDSGDALDVARTAFGRFEEGGLASFLIEPGQNEGHSRGSQLEIREPGITRDALQAVVFRQTLPSQATARIGLAKLEDAVPPRAASFNSLS
jgi:hypothetical protein